MIGLLGCLWTTDTVAGSGWKTVSDPIIWTGDGLA